MMKARDIPNSTKILIIVVIILVGGIGLVTGMLLNDQVKPIAKNISSNKTNTINVQQQNSTSDDVQSEMITTYCREKVV